MEKSAEELAASFATRLWLDHFTSHRIPAAPRSGPSFSSAESAVEKMLLGEAGIVPLPVNPVHIPLLPEENPLPAPGPTLQEEADELCPSVATESSLEQEATRPSLLAIVAEDCCGFADATGLPLGLLMAALYD